MHKEIPVVSLEIDEEVCVINKIEEIYNEAHLPVGIHITNGIVDRAELNRWWLEHFIPANRIGIRKALETLDISNTRVLLTKCYGLSLSDQYWTRPVDREDLLWRDINFFDHSFSEIFGDVLLGKDINKAEFNFNSPDITTEGCLKKRWKIIDGKRCLVKAGTAPLMLEPFNEVIATVIMEKLNIPHIPYRLIWDDEIPYCVCEDFITRDTEFVSARRIMLTAKQDSNTSLYRMYINCCEALGITDITHAVDQMIVLDYIIANEDRHLNNFGLIRNADTLEWIGAAPIFDSGSSLGYDKLAEQILNGKGIDCKPFKKRHEEQLRLVTSYAWIDFASLKKIEEDIRDVFKGAGIYADEKRIKAIISSVERRISDLQAIAKEKAVLTNNDVYFNDLLKKI